MSMPVAPLTVQGVRVLTKGCTKVLKVAEGMTGGQRSMTTKSKIGKAGGVVKGHEMGERADLAHES